MRRFGLALIAILAMTAAAAPASTSTTVSVPGKLTRQIAKVKQQQPDIPVLLPSRIRVFVPASRVFGSGGATDDGYDMELGIGRRCNGANVCFLAAFIAQRGAPLPPGRRVTLTGGVRAYFKPTTCGASCSPPEVDWVQNGVLYAVQYKGASSRAEKRTLVKLANSAIAAGPR